MSKTARYHRQLPLNCQSEADQNFVGWSPDYENQTALDIIALKIEAV